MSDFEKIKPCKCGYEGALAGTDHGAFYSLICPKCSHSVDAFTIRGLGEAWNRSVSASTAHQQQEGE